MLAAVLPFSQIDRLAEVLGTLRTAAPTLEEVAEAMGLDGDPLSDLLERAEAAGVVEPWQLQDGPLLVSLTPWSAERAGLRIAESSGESEAAVSYRWEPVETPDPSPRPLPSRGFVVASVAAGPDHRGDFLDGVADLSPGPVELVDFGARQERNRARREAGSVAAGEPLFRPIHIAGLGAPWVTASAEKVCSGCFGRALAFMGYCAKCDRCGFDALITPPSQREIRAMIGPPAIEAAGLSGGVGARKRGARPARPKAKGNKRLTSEISH